MKKGDILWLIVLGLIITFILHPNTNITYTELNLNFPYIMGFVKFFILATMGELLSLRILNTKWTLPSGVLQRSIIWGFLGMVISLIFVIFPLGLSEVVNNSNLFLKDSQFFLAFAISTVMNLTFAPTMMAFHRITDTYIDIYYEEKIFPSLNEVSNKINWEGFISFVVLKTIPLFWIPAHTITFLLPSEYRVLVAALLSIALGGILGFAKKRGQVKTA